MTYPDLEDRNACSVAAHSPTAFQPIVLCHAGQAVVVAEMFVLRIGTD